MAVESSPDDLKIRVIGLNGDVCGHLLLPLDTIVGALKRTIGSKVNIPSKRQRLLHSTTILRDDMSLSQCLGQVRADNSDPFDLFREKELDIALMKRPDDQVDALEQIEQCLYEDALLPYLEDITNQDDKLHLLDEIDIIWAAVPVSHLAMEYASERIRRDKHYILELLRLDNG